MDKILSETVANAISNQLDHKRQAIDFLRLSDQSDPIYSDLNTPLPSPVLFALAHFSITSS